MAAAPVLGDLVAANGTPAWARLAGNTTATRKFLRQTGTGTVSALPAWDTLLAGDLPAHTHAESDVTSLATDLTNRPVKGGAWAVSKAAVINSSGQLDGAAGTATDCVLVNGSSAAKANAAHTHAATDIVSGTLDNARTSGTASATASTLVLRDGSGGASFGYVAANNQWAYLDSHFQSLECGAYQTVGGPFENMAKYSEDFTVATWDKNGGSCSATANSTAAPDGNTTADTITAVTATPIIQQQVAGLASGGQYTFYVWAKVASGTKQVSIAIVDNAYAGYLAGPTSITLTTAWQRFKITGTLAGGQTGLWIVVRQFAGNGDNWTSGAIYLWGACLQQGNDPKNGYARTWASQTAARRGRNRVRRGRDRGEGQRGVAASDLRSRLEPRRPQAARGHRRRRTDPRGRHRQRLPPRRTDGRHQSVRMVRRAQSEEPLPEPRRATSCSIPTRNP